MQISKLTTCPYSSFLKAVCASSLVLGGCGGGSNDPISDTPAVVGIPDIVTVVTPAAVPVPTPTLATTTSSTMTIATEIPVVVTGTATTVTTSAVTDTLPVATATLGTNSGTTTIATPTLVFGRVSLAGAIGTVTMFLDFNDDQFLVASNTYFTTAMVDQTASIPVSDDVKLVSTLPRRSAYVTLARPGGKTMGVTLSAPLGVAVVNPLTTLADYLTRKGYDSTRAINTVATAFALTADEVTSDSATVKNKTAQIMATAMLAHYQQTTKILFGYSNTYIGASRAAGAAEVLGVLPSLVPRAPAFTDFETAYAWLLANNAFIASEDLSNLVLQAVQSKSQEALKLGKASTTVATKTGATCIEPDAGVTYQELGRMILGSDGYATGAAVGFNENDTGTNQLFAGSCGAKYNSAQSGWHTGIDYQVGSGGDSNDYRRQIPQYSVVNGVVTYVSATATHGGLTNYGIVTIRDDRNANRYWRYLHLDSATVRVGDRVSSGCLIGRSGGTGGSKRAAFGIHAHLEVWESSRITSGGTVAYQPTAQEVLDYGFKNPRELIDTFIEPHGEACPSAANTARRSWTYQGQIPTGGGKLLRAIGFRADGSIYLVDELGVVEAFSTASPFNSIVKSQQLAPTDFGTSYIPNIYSAATFENRLVLGANGGKKIPIIDLNTLAKTDSFPYSDAAVGKNGLVRSRLMFPESIGFSRDGTAITVFGSGQWNDDGTTSGEKLNIPNGRASTNVLSIPGAVCFHTAFKRPSGSEGTIIASCDGNLNYMNELGALTKITNLNAQGGIDSIVVSKNADSVFISYNTGNTRVIQKSTISVRPDGTPVLGINSQFGVQPLYSMYPALNPEENALFVQRYVDFQIWTTAGQLLSTVQYPTNVRGTPSNRTAKLSFRSDGKLLAIPLNRSVLIYKLN